MMNKNIFSEFKRAYLIAEIGVNHNGDMQLAKKMIDAAKSSGADAVKFQTFTASKLVSEGTPKVEYQKNTTSPSESHYEMIRRLELSLDSHLELKDYCDQVGIDFLSTPYDVESAKFLDKLGVKFFKTASADLVDFQLHQFIASTGKPAIIATGMATLDEVERVVRLYIEAGNSNVILLHCVSNYPCSDSSINLLAIKAIADAFSLPVGFSDHSVGNVAAVLSIALGAKVIEKHFTLDKNLPGPDHLASSTPDEFYELATSVRRAEKILGKSQKSCQEEEKQMARVSRKSIILGQAMRAGDVLSEGNLVLKRPGTGIDPFKLPQIYGKKIRIDCGAGHLLSWSDIQ